MAEFPELRESHRQPSFLRPIDTLTPPGRKYRAARHHRSWLPSTPENPRRPPPPPQPVPIPSPHIKARGIAELSQNLYSQYVDVDRDGPDLESRTGPRENSPEEQERTLFGSLMSGLKGFSKAMMRDRSPVRNPESPGAVLSGYESPGRPGSFYVQASRLPVAEPAPAAIRQHHSPSRTPERLHDRHGSLDLYDSETTVVHHEATPLGINLVDPVAAEPRASADYTKMDLPADASSDISIPSRISSVHQFFRDLNDLPWVATHVAAEYVPGQTNTRRRTARRRPIASWYSRDRRHSIDILSGRSSPTPVHNHRRASSGTLGPSPVVLHRDSDWSPKTSHVAPPPAYPSESNAFPKYPHGYAPAPPPQPRFVAQSISAGVGGVRGHREAQSVAPVYSQGVHEPAHFQYPYPISRPPVAQTS